MLYDISLETKQKRDGSFQTRPNYFFVCVDIVNTENVLFRCVKAILYLRIHCLKADNYRHFDILACRWHPLMLK